MTYILLLILKILGFLLLILFVFFLLAVCCILYVPITFRIRAEKQEDVHIDIRGSWLFHCFSVHYALDREREKAWNWDFQIRILGIPAQKLLGKMKNMADHARHRKLKKEDKKRNDKFHSKEKAKKRLKELVVKEEAEIREEEDDDLDLKDFMQNCQAEEEKNPYKKQRQRKIKKKISLWEKFVRFLRKLLYTIQKVCDRIKNIWEKLLEIPYKIKKLSDQKDKLLEFWILEEHRRARSAILAEVQYLIKKLRPKKMEGYLKFGFSDPSVTGIVLGAASMFTYWRLKKFDLIPDFEREILEGRLFIRGKIRMYVYLRMLRRMYFNRDIRHMYDYWRQ